MWPLVIPYIAIIFLIITAVSLVCKRFLAAFIFCIILVFINWTFHIVTLNLGQTSKSDFKVLSFNAGGHLSSSEDMFELISFVSEQEAGIVFIAENYGKMHYEFVDSMQARYPYISDVSKADGTILFSKYPILKSEYISGEGSGSIAYCDILISNCSKITL